MYLLISFAIILQSCVTQPIFYHSEAELPFYHSSTKTIFKLIKEENASNNFQFGVVSAEDNDALTYVLFAPGKPNKIVNNLVDVNLSYSIPLLPEQVKEFIKILNSSADKWDDKFETKDGIGFEFLVSPENLVVQKSENVFIWYPTLRFYFQNNEDGPLGTLLFGEGTLSYFYRLEKVSELRELVSMLNLAIKKN
jgi:hypothetical protein